MTCLSIPLRRVLLALLLCAAALLAPAAALAQTPVPPSNILAPNQALRVSWEAPAVASDGLNAPAGYKVETFRESATGVVVTTYALPATTLTFDIVSTSLPSGPFLLATRAVNAAGESARGNVVGPFGIGTAPGIPPNTRASVVPAP